MPAGRHRHRRSQLSQVASLRHGARGRAAVLRRGVSADRLLDVRQRADAARSRRRCSISRPPAGFDRVRMIALTNVTFDGHMYDTRRVMEECLAIKPDLVFLWDEAWFGFAQFQLAVSAAHRDGCATRSSGSPLPTPGRWTRTWSRRRPTAADLDPTDARLLDVRLVPDPRVAKVRVYQTNSTHKSMSALRQGSMVLVGDEEFHRHEPPFHEAVFTHASTSPNLQIIASLDVARRPDGTRGLRAGDRMRSRSPWTSAARSTATRCCRGTSACCLQRR